MSKPCPLQAVPLSARIGGHLEIGRVEMKTWNPTTKEFETLVRQKIVDGPGGNKTFRGKPWMLIG